MVETLIWPRDFKIRFNKRRRFRTKFVQSEKMSPVIFDRAYATVDFGQKNVLNYALASADEIRTHKKVHS